MQIINTKAFLLKFFTILAALVICCGMIAACSPRAKPPAHPTTYIVPLTTANPNPADNNSSSHNLDNSIESRYLEPPKPTAQEKQKIALLVPLTGSSSALGKALLDAAQLALFDINSSAITLVPLDTKGTAEGAAAAAKTAVKYQSRLILGPLFSQEAEAVAPIAKGANIAVISFSNNQSLARKGIYLLGFMPEQQIRRVVDYAYSIGERSFSALISQDNFGSVAEQSFKEALNKKNIEPKEIGRYKDLKNGLSQALARFKDFDPDRIQNLKQKKTDMLLVPEGGRNLETISLRLFRKGMNTDTVRLLGSGQWDDESIKKNKKLIGSWFASSPPEIARVYETHFKQTYDYSPARISSLAYDGVALAAFLANDGDFSHTAITNTHGFSGINGVFRINPDGTSERALAVIEITPKGFEVIDAAPTEFGN